MGSVLGVGFGDRLRGVLRRRTANSVNNNHPGRVVGQTIGKALSSFVSDLLPFLAHSHFLRRSVYTPMNPILLELIDQLLVMFAFLFFSKLFCLLMGLAPEFFGVGDRKFEFDIGVLEFDCRNQRFDVVGYEFIAVICLMTNKGYGYSIGVIPAELVMGAAMIETVAVSLGSSMESGCCFVNNLFNH
jgi:hypothetical protein